MFELGADRLIHDFMTGAGLQPEAVIGFMADGTLLQNSAARRFSPADVALLQEASRRAEGRGHVRVGTSLGDVEMSVRSYGLDHHLVRIRLRPLPAGSVTQLVGNAVEWREVVRAAARARASRKPLVIAGEVGSGRTSLATGAPHGAAVPDDVEVIDASRYKTDGAQRWFARVSRALNGRARLVVSNVDMLGRPSFENLRALVQDTPTAAGVTLTASLLSRPAAEPLAQQLGAHLIHVPALRERPADIEELWTSFARREGASTVRPEARALAILKQYGWPGNLRELHHTVAHVCAQRRQGVARVADLPPHIRAFEERGLMVAAEQDAIHRALVATGGNRTRAAQLLGISRATIYRKAKALGIPS
ncbi:helix-turn-helix domain-containing protein [Microbacterium sp. MC2]